MGVTFSLADGTATGRQEILSVSGSLDSTAISSMRSRLARVSPGCDGVCIDLSVVDQFEKGAPEALALVILRASEHLPPLRVITRHDVVAAAFGAAGLTGVIEWDRRARSRR